MKLSEIDWPKVYRHLFVDQKMRISTGNVSSIKSRFKILVKFLNGRPLNKDSFSDFMAHMMEKKYKNTYLNGYIKLIHHLDKLFDLQQFSEVGYFQEEVLVKDTLTSDEIESLANATVVYQRSADTQQKRYKALIYFLGTTGCRISEALNLQWGDVQTNPCRVIFRMTKNGETRVVPLGEEIYSLIMQIPKDNTQVFGMADEKRFSDDLKHRAEICGIKKRVYPHLFRHSYITEMIKQQVPIVYVGRIVGHKSIETTNKYYLQLMLDDLIAASTSHPILSHTQTVDSLANRIRIFIEKNYNPDKIGFSYNNENNQFAFKVWNKENRLPIAR